MTTVYSIESSRYVHVCAFNCMCVHVCAFDQCMRGQDFVVQSGDPTGTGAGGESIYGKFFVDEIHPELRHTGAVSVCIHTLSVAYTHP